MYDTYMQIENTIGALALALDDRITKTFGEHAATGSSRAGALVSLYVRGSLNIDALRRILDIKHSTCVRLADHLEAAGLVRRRPSSRDRRAVELELTDVGEDAARELLSARNDVIASALAPLSRTDRVQLARLVALMLRELTTDRTSARHICRLCDHSACRHADPCPVDAAATVLEQ
jgi:DNA-binding MarR family transcriptional regulator